MEHSDLQRAAFNSKYQSGLRAHVVSNDPLVRYLTSWRLKKAMNRLASAAGSRLNVSSDILCLCSGEGLEGSILCDLGYTNVTVSDISPAATELAIQRDPRLKAVALDLDSPVPLTAMSDVVIVQDGLHHLSRPTFGFTQMLDMARLGIIFLEPHESIVGKLLGTRWERQGQAECFVFRWNRSLVHSLSCSRLGRDRFDNLSFSFWHHNPLMHRVGRVTGSVAGVFVVKVIKAILDGVAGYAGNQFCGLVIKR